MADKHIRIGKISKIDYENGMASVTYPDMDNAVTALFPILSFNDEYKMPAIGEEVLIGTLQSRQDYPERMSSGKNSRRLQDRRMFSSKTEPSSSEGLRFDTSAHPEISLLHRF